MYESGVPVTAIANALGRSMDGIEVRASHLKLERPRPKQTEVYWQVENLNASEAGAPESRTGHSGSRDACGWPRQDVRQRAFSRIADLILLPIALNKRADCWPSRFSQGLNICYLSVVP